MNAGRKGIPTKFRLRWGWLDKASVKEIAGVSKRLKTPINIRQMTESQIEHDAPLALWRAPRGQRVAVG